MTEYFVKHTSKLLFPHLARDQRKRRMFVILVVTMTTLSTAGALAAWMASTGFDVSRIVSIQGLSLWQK